MSKLWTALAGAIVTVATGLVVVVPPASAGTDDPFFSQTSISNRTFYPLVRDGFKDYVHLYWASDEYPWDVTSYGADYAVTDSDGDVVYTDEVGTERTYLQWRGIDEGGATVPVGTYTITLDVYDVYGDPHVITESTTVTTKRVRRTGQVYADSTTPGMYAFDWAGDSCDVEYPYDSDGMILDCWGGKFIEATFTLKIPERHRRTARITDFWKSGRVMCCRPGDVDVRLWKVNKRTIKASFRVTGWRAYKINYVILDYRYYERI